jgi:membrane-associated phospholipid phosphatase
MPHLQEQHHQMPPEARVAMRSMAGVLAGGAASLAGVLVLLLAEGRWDPIEDVDVGVATALHDAVRDHPNIVSALDVVAKVCGPGVFRAAVVLAAIVLWVRGWRRLAAWCGAVVVLGGLIGVGMKYAVARARPVLPDPVAAAPGYSFPSGHALTSALCCGILLVVAAVTASRAVQRAGAAAAAVLVLLTGFDRVALGVHFTSDVLAGWCTAGAVVLGGLGAVHLDRLRFRRRSRVGTTAA